MGSTLVGDRNRFLNWDRHVPAIAEAIRSRTEWTFRSDPAEAESIDCLILVKPELLLFDGEVQEDTLHRILSAVASQPLRIHGVCYIPGHVIRARRLVQRIYPVLAGWAALDCEYDGANLRPVQMAALAVAGGHILPIRSAASILAQYHSLTAERLGALFDLEPSQKLGNGIYVRRMCIEEDDFIAINGFYPAMLERLANCGAGMLAFHCSTSVPWQFLHQAIVGSVDPCSAMPGSLRAMFGRRNDTQGDLQLSKARNGFHVSPGPIEALWEVVACFNLTVGSQEYKKLRLVRRLREVGISERQLAKTNPATASLSTLTRVFSADEDNHILSSAALIGSLS